MTGGGNGSINLYKYSYPAQRVIKDPEGMEKGVMGTVELLNSRTFSTQPINSFDWHPDKEGLLSSAPSTSPSESASSPSSTASDTLRPSPLRAIMMLHFASVAVRGPW
eukprot:CAMPEP_0196754224 /NCGR_PEP_ID=MMETSP1091-20130531/93296_1 /TAXON_ID=302021 /ORGANISM="Rhodomonas sp., Strain CCMP768" /LENGTH=107 /DNA_ID=CAMNT_0042102451 /DNA_START=31 /DNA_END=352 /DNA_ORIENTATION=+